MKLAKSIERHGDAVFLALACAMLGVLFLLQGNTLETGIYGHSLAPWLRYEWNLPGGAMSHGWLVPFVSGYFLWIRRRQIAAASKKTAVTGLVFIVMCLCLHWLGLRGQQPRISLVAFIGLLWSIPLYIYGWNVARLLLFPCAYLLLAVPMAFLDGMTFPLRLFGTAVSAGILNGLGIEVIRVGTAIHSAAGKYSLGVEDPCSGIRSLLALMAVTAAYAQVNQRTLVRKWILFLLAVPLALAGNICRIVTIGIVGDIWSVDRAMKLYHDYSAYPVFFFAVVLMMACGALLNADWRTIWKKLVSKPVRQS